MIIDSRAATRYLIWECFACGVLLIQRKWIYIYIYKKEKPISEIQYKQNSGTNQHRSIAFDSWDFKGVLSTHICAHTSSKLSSLMKCCYHECEFKVYIRLIEKIRGPGATLTFF